MVLILAIPSRSKVLLWWPSSSILPFLFCVVGFLFSVLCVPPFLCGLFDTLNWIMSKMISFNLATTSKRSNAPEGALYQSSGMRLTATSRHALTLGRLWTGSRANLWCTTRVTWRSSTTETTFTNTEWVSGSDGAIISRSVTSCAGMTAFLVLLAQTRVGFPQWRAREKLPSALPAQEQAFQKEEAYARATVALTRAQQICSLWAHWTCKDSLEAAIIGCLKYGACFSRLDEQEDSVFLIRLKDHDLLQSPDDSAFPAQELMEFIRLLPWWKPTLLRRTVPQRWERLHLIVVDLHRRRRMTDRVLRLLVDLQVDRCAEECLHALPIQWKQNQKAYQLRYVFGYAMEGSDLPCYILGRSVLQNNPSGALMPGKVIGCDWIHVLTWLRWKSCFNPQRPCEAAAFSLTPRRIPAERKASPARREVDQDMVWKEERVSEVGSDADSGWSGVSDNSSTDSECTPHQLPLTRIGSTLPMRRCRTW